MKWARHGLSQFVSIIISVIIVIAIGTLLFGNFTGYISSSGRITALALTGQLNTQSGGLGILTVTVRNTGTTELTINASNPGDVLIGGPGDPIILKVGPLGIIQLSPGSSMTVLASLSGVQQSRDYIVVINILSSDGTQNSEQIRIRAQ